MSISAYDCYKSMSDIKTVYFLAIGSNFLPILS